MQCINSNFDCASLDGILLIFRALTQSLFTYFYCVITNGKLKILVFLLKDFFPILVSSRQYAVFALRFPLLLPHRSYYKIGDFLHDKIFDLSF